MISAIWLVLNSSDYATAAFIFRWTKSSLLLQFPFVFYIWLVRPRKHAFPATSLHTLHVHRMNNKQRKAWIDSVRLSSILYQSDLGEQVEKRFWFAQSDIMLVFQFDCLVFGNKKKDFVLSWAQSSCCVSPLAPLLSYFPEAKSQVWNMNSIQ